MLLLLHALSTNSYLLMDKILVNGPPPALKRKTIQNINIVNLKTNSCYS